MPCDSHGDVHSSLASCAAPGMPGHPAWWTPSPGSRQPVVDIAYVSWHTVQVFKGIHEPASAGAGR
jgi:hypothetical protein